MHFHIDFNGKLSTLDDSEAAIYSFPESTSSSSLEEYSGSSRYGRIDIAWGHDTKLVDKKIIRNVSWQPRWAAISRHHPLRDQNGGHGKLEPVL